jgi:class 3 adenylate cyclase/tetratricopeptide (TPR) repeat protein
MKCPRCQEENPPRSKFCLECGGRLLARCPACQADLPGGAKFCSECGHSLAASEPGAATRFASPERYIPKHLAEKILTRRGALEGERKQVTVLFGDLKGSMELLAERDPEEARQILDPVLELMMEAVHRYEGTVNQVLGDGIMALFGAPVAHEDHAVRACYAALAMQAAVRRHNAELRRGHGIEVQIRVGMNSGEVIVRAIGSDLHMDYSAIGQTTHLAARMEQLASAGTIRLTGETLRLAEGFVQVAPLGPVPVKGLAEPVDVHELLAATPTRTRLQAVAARGLTRFVGRADELDQLRKALEQARTGQGQVVAVVGEPGVGKSRLYWEFTHSERTHGCLVLESGSVSYGKATAYLPVIELLRAYFQLEHRDDLRRVREKVTGKVLALDRALEPSLPPLLGLLDVPVDDPAWRALDPPRRRQATLDALKRLLLRESQVQSLVLLFEDLHWIDSETQALLDALIESLPTTRLLLLVNYRPEYQHAWGSKTYYRQLRIDPLPPASAEELLDALLGGDPALDGLKRLLVSRTDGNPFFLEESVRMLVESGALDGERGTYRLTASHPTVHVPGTVQAVLAARIDRLLPEHKRLLQSAAVIGKDVPYPLLREIAEMPEDAVRAGCAQLLAAEFLYEMALFPELEYTFKHALTHEVTYGSLLQERRRALHARIGEAIEQLHGTRADEHSEELARHFTRGEAWAKAGHYARLAADRATALCADDKAVALYEQALEALRRLPPDADTSRVGIDIRLALRVPLWRAGRLDRLMEIFREAEGLANAAGLTGPLDAIYTFFVQYYWAKGQYTEALDYGRRSLDLAAAQRDIGRRVTAHYYSGHAHRSRGELAGAVRHYEATIGLLEGGRETEGFGLSGLPYCGACAAAAFTVLDQGEIGRALGFLERGDRVADAAHHVYSQTVLAISRGRALTHLGRLAEAVSLLEHAVAVCRERRFAGQTMMALVSLAEAYALVGRAADGAPLAREAIALQERVNASSDRAWMLAGVAVCELEADALDRADATADEGLGFAARQDERGGATWLWWVKGAAAARRGDHEAAGGHFARARELGEALGMRPVVAASDLGLGQSLLRAGKSAAGRAAMARAATAFRELEMRLWLERANAALGGA